MGAALVKIRLFDVVFPDVCPVCGERAITYSFIGKRYSSPPSLIDRYYGFYKKPHIDMIQIQIPVCEEHSLHLDAPGRHEVLLAIATAILILTDLFLATHIVFSLYDRLVIPSERYLLFGLVTVLMLLALYGIRPAPLQRAVAIEMVLPNASIAVLKIKHTWYAEELVQLNPLKAAFL